MDRADRKALQKEVRALLRVRFGAEIDAVTADADLAAALGERFDSLAALECITEVENAFGIEVDFVAHDVRHWFSTIERIAVFVGDELEDRALLEGQA